MLKQKITKRQIPLPVLILVVAVIAIVTVQMTVSVMALTPEPVAPADDKEVVTLTAAPTPSDTSSITNGVFMQDPKTKAIRKVTPDAIATKTNRTTKGSGGSIVTVTPAGPQTLAGLSLYVDGSLMAQGRQPQIASQPSGRWFGGWNTNVQADVSRTVMAAAQSGTIATLVAYNIPVRDCGSYSAGGANSSAAYRAWIQSFANGIGSNKAIVILEPDALPGLDCLSIDGQRQRLSDIAFAVNALASTGAATYLDAGNYTWQSASVMAERLKSANVASARGFSLNVSGYGWTENSINYGQQLVSALGGGKGFVIDTSRNGNGPAPGNEWCNPRGRALGKIPSTNTGVSSLDAYLWVKVPGESDGTCNGGPAAGEWWNEMADELIRNAK